MGFVTHFRKHFLVLGGSDETRALPHFGKLSFVLGGSDEAQALSQTLGSSSWCCCRLLLRIPQHCTKESRKGLRAYRDAHSDQLEHMEPFKTIWDH